MTEVLELSTGRVLIYSLPPEQAVKAAYLKYEKGNGSTWEYHKIKVPLRQKGQVISCGDYSAIDRRIPK